MTDVRIIPVTEMPEISEGDDLGALIVGATAGDRLRGRDVVVVTQKVVSKAEGRVVDRLSRVEAALEESRRVLRRSGDTVIAETRHGFVCANAGVDASNVASGKVVLLPLDPDASARRIRSRIKRLADVDVGVVISDTFGRPWRLGQTDVAIGIAGLSPFIDYRGITDSYGREMSATRICVADEMAGAAELVMGKTRRVCAAIVRGVAVPDARAAATDIVRPVADDLFR